MFSFKSKPQNQITEYSKVLKSFQKGLFLIKVFKNDYDHLFFFKGIQKSPFITNFEVTTTIDDL